ncbi:hypothetical protein SRIMM317S_04818 [Streptomyces rimosus subsp. rimosus]
MTATRLSVSRALSSPVSRNRRTSSAVPSSALLASPADLAAGILSAAICETLIRSSSSDRAFCFAASSGVVPAPWSGADLAVDGASATAGDEKRTAGATAAAARRAVKRACFFMRSHSIFHECLNRLKRTVG